MCKGTLEMVACCPGKDPEARTIVHMKHEGRAPREDWQGRGGSRAGKGKVP